MDSLDEILERYTHPSTGKIHGAAFIVVNRQGTVIYRRAAGVSSFDTTSRKCMTTDRWCWIASMTKLVTSVALMQMVERNLVELDTEIRTIVPKLKKIEVLSTVGADLPEDNHQNKTNFLSDDVMKAVNELPPSTQLHLESIKGKLTFRQLLSHTSGFCYDSTSPLLQRWSKIYKRTAHTFCGSMEGYYHPLLFQPGTSWAYGGGLDWTGKAIEALANVTLDKYMQSNIWQPLAVTSTTFHPELQPSSLKARQLEMGLRSSDSTDSMPLKRGNIMLSYPLQDELGGIGLFSTAEDFIKLIAALLLGDSRILSRASIEELFRPQLNVQTRVEMTKSLGKQMRRILGIKNASDVDQANHCLAGAMVMRDIPRRRRKGTVNWAGLPNCHWWLDRETGIAATLFTQIMPPRDSIVTDMLIELEEAIYAVIDKGADRASHRFKL